MRGRSSDAHITSFVAEHADRVVDLAMRARARGVGLHSFVVLLLDTRGRVGAALEWPTATKGEVCMYAVSLETALDMVAKIDATFIHTIAERPAAADVRVLVANEAAVGLTHVTVPDRPIGLA